MASVTWGPGIADVDDATDAGELAPSVPAPVVDLLAELARGGPALGLAVGTGRVALPLSARGIAVEGLEPSPHLRSCSRWSPATSGSRRSTSRSSRSRGRTTGSPPRGAWHHAVPYRDVRPSELDLMARVVGLRRSARRGACDRQPFTADSASHVTVDEKSPAVPADGAAAGPGDRGAQR